MATSLQLKADLFNPTGVVLSAKHMRTVQQILDRELQASPCKVYIFGSRAEQRARSTSDIDLAIDSKSPLPALIARLQTAFEESDIPFTVDIIDLKSASSTFKESVTKKGKLIWEN